MLIILTIFTYVHKEFAIKTILHSNEQMESLLESIKELQESEVKEIVTTRINEFKEVGKESIHTIFKELCFCIMTANCSAERCIEVQDKIGNGFLTLSEAKLPETMKANKYRFPNIRSKFIIEAREKMNQIEDIMKSESNGRKLREWMVHNIKGIGYKEASHFLRNIGYEEFAIVDFHIADLLAKYNIVEKPKRMTKTKYLEMEESLKIIGEKANLNLAELDLYLWYLETGKILK
ncbi:MAG: N-glycosylase/DNA lyase [Candidatus Odinarchaeota archaeon]